MLVSQFKCATAYLFLGLCPASALTATNCGSMIVKPINSGELFTGLTQMLLSLQRCFQKLPRKRLSASSKTVKNDRDCTIEYQEKPSYFRTFFRVGIAHLT